MVVKWFLGTPTAKAERPKASLSLRRRLAPGARPGNGKGPWTEAGGTEAENPAHPSQAEGRGTRPTVLSPNVGAPADHPVEHKELLEKE